MNNLNFDLEAPGKLVPEEAASAFKREIATLLGLRSFKFPGAQPVSFGSEHIEKLKKEDFYVCEKSDGVRFLMYARVSAKGNLQTYLIDRKEKFFSLPFIRLPTFDKMRAHHKTLIDGELVVDTEKNGEKVIRYLAFDLLTHEGALMIKRPFSSRQGYLRDYVIKPWQERTKYELQTKTRSERPQIWLEAKEMQSAYNMMHILDFEVPTLKHLSDGLIFTSVDHPYITGTCNGMLKWKPPNENSVDFKVIVKPQEDDPLPKFELHTWHGQNSYQYESTLGFTKDEIAKFEEKHGVNWPTYFNNKIVEVCYNPDQCPPNEWVFMRFRTDKKHGNHVSILEKIKESIKDNITQDVLRDECTLIRTDWKARHNAGSKIASSKSAVVQSQSATSQVNLENSSDAKPVEFQQGARQAAPTSKPVSNQGSVSTKLKREHNSSDSSSSGSSSGSSTDSDESSNVKQEALDQNRNVGNSSKATLVKSKRSTPDADDLSFSSEKKFKK